MVPRLYPFVSFTVCNQTFGVIKIMDFVHRSSFQLLTAIYPTANVALATNALSLTTGSPGAAKPPSPGATAGHGPLAPPLARVAEEGKCVVVKREREEECGGPCPLEAKPLATTNCTAANNRSYTFTGEDVKLVLILFYF